MKTKRHTPKAFAILTLFYVQCVPLQAVPINLVQNGSFEQFNSFNGWTLSGGLLNLGGAGAGVQCAAGNNAVGLSWQSTLYQNISTVVGQQYDFSFYMADWGPNGVEANTVYLNPSFGSTSLGTVSFNGAGKSYQNMGWRKFDYTVTATSATTQLTFYNPGVFPSDTRWPMIDNVWVTPAPETTITAFLLLISCVMLSGIRQVALSSVDKNRKNL